MIVDDKATFEDRFFEGLFLSGFFLTAIHESQDCKGKERAFL